MSTDILRQDKTVSVLTKTFYTKIKQQCQCQQRYSTPSNIVTVSTKTVYTNIIQCQCQQKYSTPK